VGDTVRLAGLTGVVEAMTLRKTTVRDLDGTLYIVPNSQITTVANQSVGYSVATVNVSVDFSANPDQVLELLRAIAMEIRNSDEFREVFVADPQILGVDAIKGSELIFRWSSRRWPQGNTPRCGSSAAACGWRSRSITCCPATPTASPAPFLKPEKVTAASRPWRPRHRPTPPRSSLRKAIPSLASRRSPLFESF